MVDDEVDAARTEMEGLFAEPSLRQARIKALPDETLIYYFGLLSDQRVVINVRALSLIEDEMKARGLQVRH